MQTFSSLADTFYHRWHGYLDAFIGVELDPFEVEDFLRVDNQAQIQKEAHRIWDRTSDDFKRDCLKVAFKMAYGGDHDYHYHHYGIMNFEATLACAHATQNFKLLFKKALRSKFGDQFDVDTWSQWSSSCTQSGAESLLSQAISTSIKHRHRYE